MSYINAERDPRKLLDLERLANILERCGSDHDGERAAAALLASKMVRGHGLRWADIVTPSTPSAPTPSAPISELRPWLLASDRLTTKERIFVRALRDHWELTPK